MKGFIFFLSALIALPLFAGPDGLDLISSRNVRMEMVFACGGDDAMCLKARDDRAGLGRNPDYNVSNIITSNVMIYQDGFRATKIGTETNAEFFEDIIYENIFVVKAGSANTLFLTDTAVVRNVLYKNFYVENGGGEFGIGSRGFAGRTPTGYATDITVHNLLAPGNALQFYGFSAATATRDSGAINFRNRNTGSYVSDVSDITGTHANNISLGTNPVIAHELAFPIEGSRHMLPGTVKVQARVSHDNGDPLTVVFFNHGNSIGTVNAPPYELDWDAPEGEHSLTFTVTDGAHEDELHAPKRFEVRSAPVFTSVEILPGNLDIGPGLSRQFQARALDQYGDLLDEQPESWNWSVSGGGSVNSSGLVTAGNTEGGPHTVSASATLGGMTHGGSATFQVTSTLNISNLLVSSGDAYVWDSLENGKLLYIDRSSTFSGIPSQHLGKMYLRNANDDKNRTGTIASFEINLPVTLNVAVTGDFDRTQSWFDGFTDTGSTLMGKRIYAKAQQPGIISLGRNGTSNMYHVFLDSSSPSNANPVASFTASPTGGQAPVIVNFDASASSDSDGTLTRYDWDFGDGTLLEDGGVSPSHSYSQEGSYTVTLTVTDNQNATHSLTRTDYIFIGNQPPQAAFSFSPTLPAANVPVLFDAGGSSDPDGSLVRYDWDFGDGTQMQDAGPTPSHSYSTEAQFTVSLTVTDDSGASDTESALVSTLPPGERSLIYHFNFDANGAAGTSISDISGFGAAAHASSYVNSNPTAFFQNSSPSPDGSFYGSFEADRSSLQFSIQKWNEDSNGVAGGSNAFTVTLLLRDFDGSSADSDGSNFFGSLDNDLLFGFSGGTGPRPLHFRANNAAFVRTSVAADLSNATSGDSNGWILVAMTYSSETDTVNFYLGREFSKSTGWNLQLLESLSYVTSSLSDEGNPLAFGDNSSRDPDTLMDDLRVYNGVLSLEEIAAIGKTPAPLAPEIKMQLQGNSPGFEVPSQTGYLYQLRGTDQLGTEPSTWPAIGSPVSGTGNPLLFPLEDPATLPADAKRFYMIDVRIAE